MMITENSGFKHHCFFLCYDNIMNKKVFVLSVLISVYGLYVLFMTGFFYWFNYTVLLTGIILMIVAVNYEKIKKSENKVIVFLRKAFISCLTVFIITECFIIGCGFASPKENADYLILFGSQVRSYGPSMDYNGRIKKAYEYLSENKETLVIVSGGQGNNEIMSEAQCGRETLIKMGIDEKRIIMEDQSTSTQQNLLNCKAIIDKREGEKEVSVVFVSANYHLLRIRYLADKFDYGKTSTLASNGLFFLVPYYYFREFFALIKEVIVLSLR